MSQWSLDNPVFTDYVFYAAVLAAKVLLMCPITTYSRITKKIYLNPEDAKAFGGSTKADPDVERANRAHRNDLENIPLFWIAGLLFVLTNPSPATARMVFRIFTASRIGYTILYLRGSALRPVVFLVGVACNFFIIHRVICTFW